MGLLFVGGEDSDFTHLGNCSVDTTAAHRRSTYSRCGLSVIASTNYDGWYGTLSAPTQAFWVTAQWYTHGATNVGVYYGSFFNLRKGANPKLRVGCVGNEKKYRLYKVANDGTETLLATSADAIPINTAGVISKIDMYVDYQASGRFKMYQDGTLLIDYSGDVTTNGDTGAVLDSFGWNAFGWNYTNSGEVFSEIIASTDDTRSLGLVTLAPTGAGNASGFDAGAYTDIDETSLSADSLMSGTANQLSQFAVTAGAILTGSLSIAAVVVKALAHKGATGPANLQLNVRTGGVDYQSGSVALGANFAPAQGIWVTNPNSGAPWTASDLNAAGFNIGVKSIT